MAQVKARDLRGKTSDELKTRLADLAKEAYNLRFQGSAGELQNLARIRLVRREIARIKTVMAESGNDNVKAKPAAKPAKTKSKAKPKVAPKAKTKTRAKKKVK